MNINEMRKLAGINEASVNISLNGTNSQEIKDLMGIFQSDSKPSMPPIGISSDPKPPMGLDLPDIKPPLGPALPPALPGLDGPMPPSPPPKLDLDDDPFGLDLDDGPSTCSSCGGIHGDEPCGESEGDWDNSPDETYQDDDFLRKNMSGGPKNKPNDIRVKDPAVGNESKFKKELWKALNEKYFTEFDGREEGSRKAYPNEEQTFSGRSDRTYFIVPNEDDYMDIQDDSRFAGDIEVPNENADIMALPNSKFRKLKMMYGNKILDLGTDYDEAVEREEKKAKRRHLANISRTKAGGSAGRRMEGADENLETVELELKDLMSKAGARIGFLVRPVGGKAHKDYEPVPVYSRRDDPVKEFLKVNSDWDESEISGMAPEENSEGMQSTREKELKGKQHNLPAHLKKPIEDAPEDQVNGSLYDEEMGDIRRLSGLD